MPLGRNEKREAPAMKLFLPKINFAGVPRPMSVSYTAVLPMPESTVFYVSGLLEARRRDRGTRWRALTCTEQAVLALRWFIDGTRVEQLALDNEVPTFDELVEDEDRVRNMGIVFGHLQSEALGQVESLSLLEQLAD